MVSTKAISTQTNDIFHPNRTITFTITSPPSMGRLVKMVRVLTHRIYLNIFHSLFISERVFCARGC